MIQGRYRTVSTLCNYNWVWITPAIRATFCIHYLIVLPSKADCIQIKPEERIGSLPWNMKQINLAHFNWRCLKNYFCIQRFLGSFQRNTSHLSKKTIREWQTEQQETRCQCHKRTMNQYYKHRRLSLDTILKVCLLSCRLTMMQEDADRTHDMVKSVIFVNNLEDNIIFLNGKSSTQSDSH